MIRIRQHGPNSELYDIKSFLGDLDRFLHPIEWEFQVDWCTGDNATDIEDASEEGMKLSDGEFRDLYAAVYQTIDGTFQIKGVNGTAKLKAVDSSFWEVSSDVEGFEEHMLEKYGPYPA